MRSRGDARPLQCWNTMCLTLLPVSKKEKWKQPVQEQIVAALKDINANEEGTYFEPSQINVHPSKADDLARRERNAIISVEDHPDADDIDDSDWGECHIRSMYPNPRNDSKFKKDVIDAQAEVTYSDFSRWVEVRREMQRIGNTFRDDGKYYKVDRVVFHKKDKEKWLFFEYYPVDYQTQNDPAPALGDMLRETTRCCIFEGGSHYDNNPEPGWFVWEEVPEDYIN